MEEATETRAADFWTRMRRRKVVQWGIAYAAGAWGFLQGLAYVSTLLDWPSRLQKLVGLALLIGLPVALVIAWYHGDRGERRVTRTELAILTLLFLLGGGLFWSYQRASDSTSTAKHTTPAPMRIPTDRSIAVLPFVNMSADRSQDYFAEGISEELLNFLAQIPEMRVTARTSSFAFKGTNADVSQISQQLGVAHVLVGSVRTQGNRARVTAQLVRSSDSFNLWSQAYDRQLTDIFEVQEDIANAVVAELKVKLLGTARTSRPTHPEAYARFLQARAAAHPRTAEAFSTAIDLYTQALALDPSYAPAWVGVAKVYCDEVHEQYRHVGEGIPLAQAAITRALQSDARYAPAHARLAWIETFVERDYEEAARHLSRALALDPTNSEALTIAASLARRLGRQDQAIAIGQHLIRQDPINWEAHDDLGLAYKYARRYDDALSQYRTSAALNPGAIGSHARMTEILIYQGKTEAALEEALRESDAAWRNNLLMVIYAQLGRAAEAAQALKAALAQNESFPSNLAWGYALLKDSDNAFRYLEASIQARDPSLGSVADDPAFDSIRKDPRWADFLRRAGITLEQRDSVRFEVNVPG